MSTEQILSLYAKTQSVKRVHSLLQGMFSYNTLYDIIRLSGKLRKRGNPDLNRVWEEDHSRDFKYLTDKDINFEEEIKTRYYD